MCRYKDCKRCSVSSGCTSTVINQCKIDKGNGTYTITSGGNYTLCSDVQGTIVIAANEVCLDLCCHTINANGATNAITVGAFTDVKIFNGRIIGAAVAGIAASATKDLQIFDVSFSGNLLDSINVTAANVVQLSDLEFFGGGVAPVGERAINIDASRNIVIEDVFATEYLSTLGAIIQITNSNVVTLKEVDVSFNTKTALATVHEFTVPTAFVAISNSNGVDLILAKVNNNVFNNNIPVDDQNNHWRTASAILLLSSTSCRLKQCQTSKNSDIASATTPDTEDYILLAFNCESVMIDQHQSNHNSATVQPIVDFMAIAVFDTNDVIITHSQANSNTVGALALGFFSELDALKVGQYFTRAHNRNCIIRNTTANDNRVTTGGAGRSGFGDSGIVVGMVVETSSFTIDKCEASYNTMGDALPHTSVTGYLLGNANNSVKNIFNSVANNNTGGFKAEGILFYTTRSDRGFNNKVLNCTTNNNGNYGISIGYYDALALLSADIEIIDSSAHQNGEAGIIAQPLTGGNTDIVIQNCKTFKNAGFGIEFLGVNTNISLIGNLSQDNGTGFFLSNTTTFSLVQDNRALGNATSGFEQDASGAFSTTYIGNEAQNNLGLPTTNNYAGTALTTKIALQEYSWTTGDFTTVNGNAALAARFVNISAVA